MIFEVLHPSRQYYSHTEPSPEEIGERHERMDTTKRKDEHKHN